MKIKTEEITEGEHDNYCVWICDFRLNDPSNKPIRHIKPMKVFVRSNTETKKNIYYSNSHFVKLKKNGDLSSTIIALFDNTGYRCNTGTALQVFDNKRECRECYEQMANQVIK